MSELSARIRVAHAAAAREVADAAHHLVGETTTPLAPGERIRAARQLRVLALSVLDRAVLVELAEGATWEQVGEALGMEPKEAWRRYNETFQMWATQQHCTAAKFGDYAIGLPGESSLESTAEMLDSWYARHTDPWETAVIAPVSQAL